MGKPEASVVLCTLCLNEMEWLPRLYKQHRAWPGLRQWVFVESADRAYRDANPTMVNASGLSVDETTEYLLQLHQDDPLVTYIPYGISGHKDLAQGKCAARSKYLEAADRYAPNFLFVLDADEFYPKDAQAAVMHRMNTTLGTGFVFKQRHIWRPLSIYDRPLLESEVVGGFWDIPHARGWKWREGLRYSTNHNTPEGEDGLLDKALVRFDRMPGLPECVHMGFASSLISRRAKHQYYAFRGEGRSDRRGWYVKSRAAFETWKPGDTLPEGAKVQPYTGLVPEVFQ